MRSTRSIPRPSSPASSPASFSTGCATPPKLHHLTYAPDPATHSRCTLGGMIGNNSCGVHGLMGGKVVDNVESLDIVLYDGTRMTVGATTPAELDALIRAGGRVGQIYAGLDADPRHVTPFSSAKKFPRIPRRVSGYNLDELLPENNFNVARALVGSEGTCANVVSATLNLTASPPFRVLTVLGFNDPFLAADAVPLALEHKPIGLEGFDFMLVDFMRRKGLALEGLDHLPPGVGFLLVEMGAWSAEEARAQAESVARASQSWPSPPVAHICTPAEAASVWHVRESALGATVFVPGEPDRWEGWEDAAVPPAALGNYLRAINTLMAEFGYQRPASTATTARAACTRASTSTFVARRAMRRFREFIERAADIVCSFGGSLSGEHGDGQSRAALLPKMFGPELIQAFREFKTLWDPDNRMNPGKLSDAARVYDPAENLRHHRQAHEAHEIAKLTSYLRRTTAPSSAPPSAAWAWAPAATRRAASCAPATAPPARSSTPPAAAPISCGRCSPEPCATKASRATPSTRRSISASVARPANPSARSRWTWPPTSRSSWRSATRAACTRCTTTSSDLPTDSPAMARSRRPLTNALLTGPLTSPLVKRIAGVAQERQLPRLARKSYQSMRAAIQPQMLGAPSFPRLSAERLGDREPQSSSVQKVLLWPDTWNNYYHPQTLARGRNRPYPGRISGGNPEGPHLLRPPAL